MWLLCWGVLRFMVSMILRVIAWMLLKKTLSALRRAVGALRNLESACNDSAVDALFICTPNYTHFEILKVAIRSGKPIFLEKPMATDLDDAAATVAISDAYSAFIQIGLQYRYKAQYIEAFHEALSRQSLGEVKTIAVSECSATFFR